MLAATGRRRLQSVNELSTGILLVATFVMILLSAFFSGSETAMMALNRYRLRHRVSAGHRGARKTDRLLQRPDRLLGVILLGNNLVIFVAASSATLIATRWFGETAAALVTPLVLTPLVLVFAEVTPKTVGARRPELLAYPSAYILQPLLKACHPLVAVINAIGNFLAAPMIGRAEAESEDLSPEELRTVVRDRTALPRERQTMLLRILDMEGVTIDDIMVPRAEVAGIDLEADDADIVDAIRESPYTRLPIYREHINAVEGVLHLRRAARFLGQAAFAKADLVQEAEEPYFVPEGTPLHTQLLSFQKRRARVALVVDEYGDVQGLVTLEDILEEIVGEFTTDVADELPEVHRQDDGSYIVEGKALLRDVNRALGWRLPSAGPRTLNGLVVAHLEFIPDANVGLRIGRYQLETLQIADNVVRSVKVRELPAPPVVDDA